MTSISGKIGRAALALTIMTAGGLEAAIELSLDWQLKPGERFYLGVANEERGLAYRAASDSLLLVSRAGTPGVHVLAATDGSDLHALSTIGVAGGFFPLNKVGVADDGAVYAANMTLNASTAAFTIYRWADDGPATEPTVAYQGDPGALAGQPGLRWGDTLEIRGSGADTQILVGSQVPSGSVSLTSVAVFTTSDGLTFGDPAVFTGVSDSAGVLGLAFGMGDSFYTKFSSAVLRHVTFDLAMGTADVQMIGSSVDIRVLASSVADNYLATLTQNLGAAGPGTVPDTVTILNISSPAAPTNETSAELVVGNDGAVNYDNTNTNRAGSIVFAGSNLYVLNTNNGIFCYTIEEIGTVPPTIDTDPLSISVLEGGIVTFSVVASGDQPLSYQWTFEGGDLPDEEGPSLEVGPVTDANEGAYAVRVSNNVGSATSADAVLTVLPRADTAVSAPKWTAAAGSRPYLSASARTHRGLAVNPVNGNVLVASREGGTSVHVLDGQTGDDLHELDLTGVSGGIFALNMIGVGDDGVVYAGNLTLNGTTDSFRLYGWPSDAAGVAPELLFIGDPGFGTANRWGDTMDVRGAGDQTQVLLGSRLGTDIAILSTFDGTFFFSDLIVTDATGGDFGLGVAFGEGDVAWGSTAGRGLRRVEFDVLAGTGTTTHVFGTGDFPAGATAIAVDVELKCLAAVVLDVPNTLQLFDISNLGTGPVRLDQELFNEGRNNVNTDGTGAVAFGEGVVYGLSTNNGILALDSTKTPPGLAPVIDEVAFVAPDQIRLSFHGEPSAGYQVQTSLDLEVWADDGPTGTLDAQGEAVVFLQIEGIPRRFVRVVTSP